MHRPPLNRCIAALAIALSGHLAARAQSEPVREAPPLVLLSPEQSAESLPPPAIDDPPGAFTPSREFQEWITDLVRKELPHEYEKEKNWGRKTRTFDGVSVKLEDGQIKTHRKYKQANDGVWQRYRVKLVNPDERFRVRVANLQELPEGRVGLDVTVVASLKTFGRQSLWEHGIQLYSLSAEATARVRLSAHVEVAMRLDPTRFPPDVILDPEIKSARFDIPDFRLERISRAHGPVVRSLSHSVREMLEEKLKEDNEKLVTKLNAQIAKQDKKLRLSAADAMAGKLGGLFAGEDETK